MQMILATIVTSGSVPSNKSTLKATITGKNNEYNSRLTGLFQPMLSTGWEGFTSSTTAITASATTSASDLVVLPTLSSGAVYSVPAAKDSAVAAYSAHFPVWQFADYSPCISIRANFHMLFGIISLLIQSIG